MWGHYASAGRGVVIEIQINSDDVQANYLKPIKYTESKHGLTNLEDVLTNKSLVWLYESEWRYLNKDMSDNK